MSKPLVVITGASSGIGEETASQFSEAGHPLLLLARRLDRLEALNLPNTMCRKVDVTNKAQVVAAIEEAEITYGPVDCLVNNAGLMQLGATDKQSTDEWDAMIDVNLKGVLYGIHAVVGKMRARKGGSIYNISSIAGLKGFPNHMAYCGTKYGVRGLSETLREEVADDNVRVTVISPGAVQTELMNHTTFEEVVAGYEDWKTAIGGALAAKDIADSILFAYNMPQNVCLREIAIAATRQQP